MTFHFRERFITLISYTFKLRCEQFQHVFISIFGFFKILGLDSREEKCHNDPTPDVIVLKYFCIPWNAGGFSSIFYS